MRTRSPLRLLTPFAHGALDYLVVGAFAMAPALFAEGTPRAAVLACYGIAVAQWLLSTVTRYPFGIRGVIPFPAHGAVELVLAPLLVALPWIAGFAHAPLARNFFIASGAALLVVWLTTDYRAAERERGFFEPPIDRGAEPPRQQA